MIRIVLILFVFASYAVSDHCVRYTFEQNYNEWLTHQWNTRSCGSRPFWIERKYSNIDLNAQNNRSTTFITLGAPYSTYCVSSFIFTMHRGGTIEVNIYMDYEYDYIQVTASQSEVPYTFLGVDSNSARKTGWHTLKITLTREGTYQGYITITGSTKRSNSILLVDSFRYIPPGVEESNCRLYEEPTTPETTTPEPTTQETTTPEPTTPKTTTLEPTTPETTTLKPITPEATTPEPTTPETTTSSDHCVRYTFEQNYNEWLTHQWNTRSCGSRPFWIERKYSNIDLNAQNNQSTTFITLGAPYSTYCVSSFIFTMHRGGTIEVNIYMDYEYDYIQVTASQSEVPYTFLGVDSNSARKTGWHTLKITLTREGTYQGYITITGSTKRSNSILLVDSFRYIPPGVEESNCRLYEEPTTPETTTPEPTTQETTTPEPTTPKTTTLEPTTPETTTLKPITPEATTPEPTTPETTTSSDHCVRYTFEQNYNEWLTHQWNTRSCGSRPFWIERKYSNIDLNAQNNQSTTFITLGAPYSTYCVSSFIFTMHRGGTIEVNIYMDYEYDYIQVTASQSEVPYTFLGVDSNSARKTGWHTLKITLTREGTYQGYITITGSTKRSNSILLVDSFRYIPPGVEESNCRLYEEPTTPETTTPEPTTQETTTPEPTTPKTTTLEPTTPETTTLKPITPEATTPEPTTPETTTSSDHCVRYTFEQNYNEWLTHQWNTRSCGSRPFWIERKYSNIDLNAQNNQSTTFITLGAPYSTYCVSSFIFTMHRGGTIEVNIYMDYEYDYIQVTASQSEVPYTFLGVDSNSARKTGWHTLKITLTREGTYQGYITITGSTKRSNSILLVDSFRYIPPGVEESNCRLYEEPTTPETTTPEPTTQETTTPEPTTPKTTTLEPTTPETTTLKPITPEATTPEPTTPETTTSSDHCVRYTFEQNYNEWLTHQWNTRSCGSRPFWIERKYSNIDLNAQNNQSTTFITLGAPYSTYCVSSFIFTMHRGGTIEVNIYMDYEYDYIQVTASQSEVPYTFLGVDSNSARKTGWHTLKITLTREGTYQGYITITGSTKRSNSILLVDSFRYIPPGVEESNCRLYEEPTTPETTTPEPTTQETTTPEPTTPKTTTLESTTPETTTLKPIITPEATTPEPTTPETTTSSDHCVRYTFEQNYNEWLTHQWNTRSCGSRPFWIESKYSNIDLNAQNNQSTTFITLGAPYSTYCVSSFIFTMHRGGTIEVNIYMDYEYDYIQVTASQSEVPYTFLGVDSNSARKTGWHTLKITLTREGTYQGYITITGSTKRSNSILLVDSFRYIPPGVEESNCRLYEEPTTPETTTPEPTTQETTTPEPTTPKTTTLEPTTPETTTLKPITPEATTPEPTTPETTTLKPITPEAATPEPTTIETTTPEPTAPDTTTPEPTTPETTTPEPKQLTLMLKLKMILKLT